MAIITLLAFSVLRTSLLVVLVFLASLALVGGRFLVFATIYVSKKGVSGLSPSRVLLLFFGRLVPLEIPEIYLTGT